MSIIRKEQLSGSFATLSSNTFTGNQTITGSVNITGSNLNLAQGSKLVGHDIQAAAVNNGEDVSGPAVWQRILEVSASGRS
jgi:hypothetical protein